MRWDRITAAGIVVAGFGLAPGAGQAAASGFLSDEQMRRIGESTFSEIKATLPGSWSFLDEYAVCIASAIVEVLPPRDRREPWEVKVFEVDQANAFALPGGKIGIYTGILDVMMNQHQVAAVVAHEVAHVVEDHSKKRMSRQLIVDLGMSILGGAAGDKTSAAKQQLLSIVGLGAQVGIVLPYSRKNETEADLVGLELMARAGFDPRESVAFWRLMMEQEGRSEPPEFLSTHPGAGNRIRTLNARMDNAVALYQQAQDEYRIPDCD